MAIKFQSVSDIRIVDEAIPAERFFVPGWMCGVMGVSLGRNYTKRREWAPFVDESKVQFAEE